MKFKLSHARVIYKIKGTQEVPEANAEARFEIILTVIFQRRIRL